MERKINPIPEGYNSITPYLTIRDGANAIEFYRKAFGAQLIFRQDRADGKIMHAALRVGNSILMFADECCPSREGQAECVRSPSDLKGTTVNFYLYVDDADAVFARAQKAGAKILSPVSDMFWGDRAGTLKDPSGHIWTVASRKEALSREEMKARTEKVLSEQPACCV